MRTPRIVIATRGTYCEAAVPDSTYFRAHPCEIKWGIQKVGRAYLCGIHRRKR